MTYFQCLTKAYVRYLLNLIYMLTIPVTIIREHVKEESTGQHKNRNKNGKFLTK